MKEVFRKYYRRVAAEGVLKALFIGLAAGSVVLALTELLSWFFGFKAGLYLGLALFAAISAGVTALLYFMKFRPTAKEIARRVDALGLEERLLTMTELENDSSYIALRQREDAVEKLSSVDHTMLKVAVSSVLVIVLCIGGVVGIGSLTTEALYVAGVIPSGKEHISEERVQKEFTVSYGVEEGEGKIVYYTEDLETEREADEFIRVKNGEDAPAVYALPLTDENWVFVRWSDGLRSPYRQDLAVSADITVKAIFAQLSDIDVTDPQLPPEMSPGQGDQEQGEGGGNEQPSDPSGDPGEGDGDDSDGGGSRNDASQQIYDGQTYYGDDYDQAYEEAKERLESDDDLTEQQKEWINDYWESIEKKKKQEQQD